VHDELERQRQRRRQHHAVVKFERRPLYGEQQKALTKTPRARTRPQAANTARYQLQNPEVQSQLPPYAGSFVRSVSVARPQPKRRARTAGQPLVVDTSTVRRKKVQSRVQQAPVRKTEAPVRKPTASPLFGERDIPFNWQERELPQEMEQVAVVDESATSESVVVRPKRRFALPIHLSVWPFKGKTEDHYDSRLGDSVTEEFAEAHDRVHGTGKKKLQESRLT